jgi:hypothetical protein
VTDRIFLRFGENGVHRCRKLSQSPNSEKDNEMKHLLIAAALAAFSPSVGFATEYIYPPTIDPPVVVHEEPPEL